MQLPENVFKESIQALYWAKQTLLKPQLMESYAFVSLDMRDGMFELSNAQSIT